MSQASQFQKFEMRTVDRRDIKTADYNPRTISDHARKQLKKVIEEVGLIQPLIWNERTGTLVSEHQRLATLDSLEHYRTDGKKSYTLEVAVVNLDDQQERRMNVFLNNQSVMGEFDIDMLDAMRQEFNLDVADLGFTTEDIDIMFPVDLPLDHHDSAEASRAKDTLTAIKEERQAAKAGLEQDQSIAYYFVVVCQDMAAKEALLEAMGVPSYEEYVRGELIAAKYGLTRAIPLPQT